MDGNLAIYSLFFLTGLRREGVQRGDDCLQRGSRGRGGGSEGKLEKKKIIPR